MEAVSEPEYRLMSEDLQENDWLSNRPLKVSPYWKTILKNFSVMEKEVGMVLVEAPSQKPTSSRFIAEIRAICSSA